MALDFDTTMPPLYLRQRLLDPLAAAAKLGLRIRPRGRTPERVRPRVDTRRHRDDPPARSQHPQRLTQAAHRLVHELERTDHHHDVNAARGKRQLTPVTLHRLDRHAI